MAGYIKLHRELLEKAAWKCATSEQKNVLIALLLMANHEQKAWIWNGVKYHCQPGEFVTSQESIAELAGVSRQNVRSALKFLEKCDFLTNESTSKSTKIKINNWATYQGTPNQRVNQEPNQHPTKTQPTPNQDPTTNKNDKNIRSEEIYTPDPNPSESIPKRKTIVPMDWQPSEAFWTWLKKNHPTVTETEALYQIEKFKNYSHANGKAYLDLNAALRNWFDSPYRKPGYTTQAQNLGTRVAGNTIVSGEQREGRSGKL